MSVSVSVSAYVSVSVSVFVCVSASVCGASVFLWIQQGRHSNIDYVNWLAWVVLRPNLAIGVSESRLALSFPPENWL